MTDYAMKYSKETMREYVTHTMTGGMSGTAIPVIICAALLTAMPVASLVAYFMLNQPVLLAVVFCALLFDILLVVIMLVLIKKYTAKMLTAFDAFSGLVCSVSSEQIIIVRDGAPQNVIGWDKIDEMHEGRYAFFLKTNDEFLVILQKDNVLSGTAQETSEIIAEKKGRKK